MPVHKRGLCKTHFLHRMKHDIRKRLTAVYRDVHATYSAFDHGGTGRITLSGLLNHRDIKRMQPQYSTEDIKAWLYRDNVFKKAGPGEPESSIDFPTFKKFFFPQLLQIHDHDDIRGNPGVQWERGFIDSFKQPDRNAASLQTDVASRLMHLDRVIKYKFSTLWVSVRKAFLELDYDKDGLIEASDVLRYFGDDDNIDLVDLKTLMRQRRKTSSESEA